MPRGLDWLCIGAAKCGTTSLHHLLDTHPEVFVPRAKEIPLFHRPVTDEQVRDYLCTNFADVPASKRCGTVTPHYLVSVDIAPRVHRYFPDIPLVAVLRDPVDRAISDYNYMNRQGREPRSCRVALTEQLEDLKHDILTDPLNQENNYVRRGCYGTLLDPWFDIYGPDKILVIFTEELAVDPDGALREIEQHLGLSRHPYDGRFLRHNAHPPQHPLHGVVRSATETLRRTGITKVLPRDRRRKVADFVDRAERRIAGLRPEESAQLDQSVVSDLRSFYAPEVARVSELVGRVPPWSLSGSSPA